MLTRIGGLDRAPIESPSLTSSGVWDLAPAEIEFGEF